MEFKKTEKNCRAIKITVEENGKEIGRAYLYLISNDLHDRPYGFLEDVFVDEDKRGQGIGKKLIEEAVEEAKQQGCYKLIGTSRHSRESVHKFYEKIGFENYGIEFRMDLTQ